MIIIGAGPAGLTLGCLLAAGGMPTTIVDSATRAHAESRARAGLLEARTVAALTRAGLAEHLQRDALHHSGIEIRTGGTSHVLDLAADAGASQRVYPQQRLVADLIDTYLDRGGDLRFSTRAESIAGVYATPGRAASVLLRGPDGHTSVLVGSGDAPLDVVAADGAHGAGRLAAVRAGTGVAVRDHGVSWLTVLADAPPSSEHVIYGAHPDGFAGHMLRTATQTRFYLQTHPNEVVEDWPEERIWANLDLRLGLDGAPITRGPVVERSIFPLTSTVVAHPVVGRMALIGDAAHTVPPMGAKGANLAIGDAVTLAEALLSGSAGAVYAWSRDRVAACWDAQAFSTAMVAMMHRGADDYATGCGRAALRGVLTDPAARAAFAHTYVGVDPALART